MFVYGNDFICGVLTYGTVRLHVQHFIHLHKMISSEIIKEFKSDIPELWPACIAMGPLQIWLSLRLTDGVIKWNRHQS